MNWINWYNKYVFLYCFGTFVAFVFRDLTLWCSVSWCFHLTGKKKYTCLYIPDLIVAHIFYGAREVTWMWFFFFDSVMYSHQSGGRLKEFNVSLWKQRGGGKLKVFYKMYTFCHNCHMDMILYMHLLLLFMFVLIFNAYLLIMEWFLIYCSPEKWMMTSRLSCSNTWFQT